MMVTLLIIVIMLIMLRQDSDELVRSFAMETKHDIDKPISHKHVTNIPPDQDSDRRKLEYGQSPY